MGKRKESTNTLIINSGEVKDPEVIANEFANFFQRKVNSLI